MRSFLCLLLTLLLLPALLAQSKGKKPSKPVTKEPVEEEVIVNEDGLPQWKEKEQLSMLKGEWFTGVGLLPDETDILDPADTSFLDLTDNGNENNDLATLESEIPKEALPLYRPKDLSLTLIDPQNLLTERDHEDIKNLLEEIKTETGVNVHLVLFTNKQTPTVELNAPSLARHIFTPNTSEVLISYHLGAPELAQVIYSNDLNFPLNDEKRKSFLDESKREANFFDYSTDALWHFIAATGRQIPGLQSLAKIHPAPKTLVVPKVDYVLEPDDKPEKKPPLDLKKIIPELWESYGLAALVFLFFFIILITAFVFYKKTRKYPIPNVCPRPRFDAPHGLGTSRTFYFHVGKPSKNEKFLNDMFKD